MVFAKRLFDLFGGCYSLVLPEQPQTKNGKFTICEINFTFLHLLSKVSCQDVFNHECGFFMETPTTRANLQMIIPVLSSDLSG
jgi:hypothetical protein